jgi:hypothetical protein
MLQQKKRVRLQGGTDAMMGDGRGGRVRWGVKVDTGRALRREISCTMRSGGGGGGGGERGKVQAKFGYSLMPIENTAADQTCSKNNRGEGAALPSRSVKLLWM